MAGPRYRGLRLDGPIEEFHQAIDRLRWDTIPAPLDHQPATPPASRRRHDPSDGQATLLDPSAREPA
jgi:hypothetical protein